LPASARRFCYSNLTRGRPICVSDEHYLPTLLASYGWHGQTDCLGLAHYADWSSGGWHPRTFGAADVLDAVLVARMRAGAGSAGSRSAAGCDVDAALGSARQLLLSQRQAAEAAVGTTHPGEEAAAGYWQQRRAPQLAPRPPNAGLLQRLGQLLQPLAWLLGPDDLMQRQAFANGGEGVSSKATVQALDADSAGQRDGVTAADNTGSGQHVDAPAVDSYSQQMAAWVRWQLGYQAMGPHCSLIARKFTADALPGTLQMALSCGGLGLGSWCGHNLPQLEGQW
jgi:hypothetical protein